MFSPLLPWIRPQAPCVARCVDEASVKPEEARCNPFLPFKYPDVLLSLSFTGVVYAVNYTITSTISSSFQQTYPYLTQTELGLCYLSTGLGMMVGCIVTGRLLDREYLRLMNKAIQMQTALEIETARLRTMPFHLVMFAASTIGWGWCIQTKANIAAPLCLQVIRTYF